MTTDSGSPAATIEGMEEKEQNPYESPLALDSDGPRPVVDVSALLSALVTIAACTLGGLLLGAASGLVVLMLTPKELAPSCGNTVVDPLALAGAAVGFVGGTLIGCRIWLSR